MNPSDNTTENKTQKTDSKIDATVNSMMPPAQTPAGTGTHASSGTGRAPFRGGGMRNSGPGGSRE